MGGIPRRSGRLATIILEGSLGAGSSVSPFCKPHCLGTFSRGHTVETQWQSFRGWKCDNTVSILEFLPGVAGMLSSLFSDSEEARLML